MRRRSYTRIRCTPWAGGLCYLCAVTIAASLSANDIFVNNVLGDDRLLGTHADTQLQGRGPVRSISKALRLAGPGDRISVANTGQPYRETVSLFGARHSGSGAQPFVVEGHGAVLDGTQPVPARAWEVAYDDVFRFRPARRAYLQLFLGETLVPRSPLLAAEIDPGQLPPLPAGGWLLHDGYVHFRPPQPRPIGEFELRFTALPVGITLYDVSDVIIDGLVVQGYQLDGLNAHDVVRRCTLVDVVSRANGRAGLAVEGSSQVDVLRGKLAENGHAQLLTSGVSLTRLDDTQLLPETAPDVISHGGDVLEAEPAR